MNVTNEQLAEIMGWTQRAVVLSTTQNGMVYQANDQRWYVGLGTHHTYPSFDPTSNPDHTVLVEQRVQELGIDYTPDTTATPQKRCNAVYNKVIQSLSN